MTGPRISAEDEKALQARLLADAREWQQKMEGKINEVGACLRTAAGNRLRVKFHFVGGIEQARGRMHPDAVNAWTDGQSIWITRGMMRFLKSEDELAIVLAHEPAHAARGHMGAKHAKKALSVLLGPASGIGMLLVNAATREYEKDQEREADLYGLVWAHKAGFNVDGATDLLKRMAVKAPESLSGGFLSHHPTSAERLPALDKVAQSLKKGLDPLIIFRSQESKKQSAT
ncbi:MAG TPA: M48 family metalloprotease [Candidatus Acidoferrales bacterium]|nr:M48 family metalloprotease [Candidatus Acidoferrales bacterium]